MLIALAWPNHVHHARAHRWFEGRPGPWATTPVTEMGFVRVSSNRAAMPSAVEPAQALQVLAAMVEVPGHVFLADDVERVLGADLVRAGRVLSHQSVIDAHLLSLARRHEGRLVTLDAGLRHLAGSATDVLVIP